MNERKAQYATMSASRVRKQLRGFHKQFQPYRRKLVEYYSDGLALRIA